MGSRRPHLRLSLEKFFNKSNLLSITMKSVRIFNCAPLKVNNSHCNPSEANILFESKTGHTIKQLKLRSYLNCFAALFQLFQLVISLSTMTTRNSRNFTSKDIFMLFIWIVFAGGTVYTHISRNIGPNSEVYLNNLLKFNRNYRKKSSIQTNQSVHNHSVLEFLNLLLVPMLLFTSSVFPPIYSFGLHWKNPCEPSLIGYFLLPECHDLPTSGVLSILHEIIAVLVKITIILGNMWFWWFALFGSLFTFAALHIIGTIMLYENIVLFWKGFTHSTSVYTDAILYRQLQILNMLSNSVQQRCLGVLIFGVILCLSTSLSLAIVIVKGSSQQSYIVIAMVLIMIINATASILVVFGEMVSVYAKSKEIIQSVKHLEYTYRSRECRRWSRRYWRSCGILKTKFGDNNFLERGTPLRCLDFSFNLTVQFLLLARNG